MNILGYEFQGPYQIGTELINRAAIYVILDENNNIVDVGQTGEVGIRL
ncbi:hypothetical protein KKF32_04405 [Patescibacteria group bacterium]|nr:hypothetical protein [Patescibacteria group bacterium]